MICEEQDSLHKAQQCMKKYVDQDKCSLQFNVCDQVLLKLAPQIQKQITSKVRHRGLIPKYDVPFKVVQKVGKVSYRLKLSERLMIHPIFHVSFLKPYFADIDDPDMNKTKKHILRYQFNLMLILKRYQITRLWAKARKALRRNSWCIRKKSQLQMLFGRRQRTYGNSMTKSRISSKQS